MYPGCPSERIKLTICDNSNITWWTFHQTWYSVLPPLVDELIRCWARSAQRQGTKVYEIGLRYAIFPSLTRHLKNPWVDFHQTWYRGAPPGVDDLFRFWARSAQLQRSIDQWTWLSNVCYLRLVDAKSLKYPWVDFDQTFYRGAPPGLDELH